MIPPSARRGQLGSGGSVWVPPKIEIWHLLRLPVPVFGKSCEIFSWSNWNFPHYSLCPVPLILAASTSGKSLALYSLYLALRQLNSTVRFYFSILGLISPTSLPLITYHAERCSIAAYSNVVLWYSYLTKLLCLA